MQEILNRYPPPGRDHWRIPESGLIMVHVRIHWRDDGIEWVDALAKRWTGQHVWVEFPDVRLYGGGVWLNAKDVKRR